MIHKHLLCSIHIGAFTFLAILTVSTYVIRCFRIGGGLINVALIIFLLSYPAKTATVCSLVTVLFAQISKLAMTAQRTGFAAYDLSIALVMVVGAIAGGFIGTGLNKRFSEKAVEQAFNGV